MGVFNIAAHNYTLRELANIVASTLVEFGIHAEVHVENRADVRSYRVTTDKAASALNFTARKSMEDTVREVARRVVGQTAAELEDRRYYNIRQMEHLIAEGLLHRNGHATATEKEIAAAIAG